MTGDFNFDEEIDRREVPALKTHPMVLGKDGTELFPAGVADMDFRVAQPILEAMQDRLNHGVFGYEATPDGLIPAMLNWQKTLNGWDINADHVLRAPNVLNSLAIAASLFSDAGDGIIVQPPVFFDFFDIIKENKRRIVTNPLVLHDGRYQMDFDGLETLARDPTNKILFLCNPHNPVGRVWTRDELTRLGTICRTHNVLVVSDELHGDLAFTGHTYVPFASLGAEFADSSITLVSPAKSFNIAGCCWSFTIVPDAARRHAFQTENSRLTVNKNNAFSSAAMQAAYTSGGAWLDAAMAYIQGNLDLVRTELREQNGVDLIEPDGTFLLWLDFRRLGLSPDDLTTFLRKKAGWAVTRGVAFGDEGAGFARLNIACPRPRLARALRALAHALKSEL